MLIDSCIVSKNQEELSQAHTRLKISFFVFLTFTILSLTNAYINDKATILTSLHLTLSTIIYLYVKSSKDISYFRIYTSVFIDLAFITITIHYMGLNGLSLYPILLWTVIANGIRFGKTTLFIATTMSSLLFLFSAATLQTYKDNESLIYALTTGIIALSWLFSNMIDRLHNFNDKLETTVELKTKEIEYKYIHDSLTGLKNIQALKQDIKKFHFHALLIIDIEQFHNYNTLYNIEVGDEILKQVASYLIKYSKSKNYEVYRTYSDHFILRVKKKITAFTIHTEINNILKIFEKHKFYIKQLDDSLSLDITIGATLDSEKPHKKSQMALEYAKYNKIKYSIYDKNVDTKEYSKNFLKYKNLIKEAIQSDNVIALFQPIVDRDNNYLKYEALMRLRVKNSDNKVELISPFQFLDIAIKSKLYHDLTLIMIEHTAKFLDRYKNIEVSINLSFEDMTEKKIFDALVHYIQKYDIGDRIIFEIVESSDITDFQKIKTFIYNFKKLGVKFAIDDFGSGYSNFSHLAEILPEYIKIDGSLIKNIDKDKKSYYLVSAIIYMAKKLNIKIVAEFVSSKEIYDICYNLGVDYFQGYYFDKPLNKEEVEYRLHSIVN